MINPNDVELLIFDLDGTIFSTTKPIFEAIKGLLLSLIGQFDSQRET